MPLEAEVEGLGSKAPTNLSESVIQEDPAEQEQPPAPQGVFTAQHY